MRQEITSLLDLPVIADAWNAQREHTTVAHEATAGVDTSRAAKPAMWEDDDEEDDDDDFFEDDDEGDDEEVEEELLEDDDEDIDDGEEGDLDLDDEVLGVDRGGEADILGDRRELSDGVLRPAERAH